MKALRDYAGESASATMEAFADFAISEIYGGSLPAGIDEKSFREGIRLGGSTRGYFQKSDFWKNDPRNYLANVDANRAAKAAEKAEKAKASAEKARLRAEKAIADAEAIAEAAKAKLAALAATDADETDADETDADETVTDAPETDADETAPRSRRSRRAA